MLSFVSFIGVIFMKLNNNNLQWIYDHVDDFKRALVALDYVKQLKVPFDDRVKKSADEAVHDYAFSFLMMAMGEHPPKTLWSANDYSILYRTIMDANEDIEITDDE